MPDEVLDAAEVGLLRIVSAGPPALGASAAGGGSREELDEVMSVYAGIGALLRGRATVVSARSARPSALRHNGSKTYASDHSLAFCVCSFPRGSLRA